MLDILGVVRRTKDGTRKHCFVQLENKSHDIAVSSRHEEIGDIVTFVDVLYRNDEGVWWCGAEDAEIWMGIPVR